MAELYIPWAELYEVADNFGGIGLARDVSRLICRVRQDRPWMFDIANNTGGLGLGLNPLVSNFMWSRICSLFPPDPGDAQCQQFFGGQCPGMQYSIRIFDGDGQLVGTTSPPAGVPVGPLTCIRTFTGPSNYFLDNPPIPTSYTVQGVGQNGPWGRSVDTKVATPRRDTRLFTYQIVPPPGMSDNCGNATYDIDVPVDPPDTFLTIETAIFGQTRNVTVNLPTLDVSEWPDFSWTPIIEFDGIEVEFSTEGMNINLPDNITLNTGSSPPGTVGNINNTVNNIENIANNIQNQNQTISNTLNNANETINNISNSLQQEFTELNERLDVDIQAILDAIERCCCRAGVTIQSEVLTSGTPGGRFLLPEKTVAVLFELSLPATDRTPLQVGSGSAARVYHWGSYSIGYSVNCEGDRVPLQWERQAVPVAKYATNVTIWPTYENIGSIRAFYEVDNP